MLSPREHLHVVNLYAELKSYRAVAALVGCDHKTVKAHLERELRGAPLRVERPSIADPYAGVITSKLEVTEGRITAKAQLRVIRAAGYGGSARTLRRAVAEAKAEWRRRARRVYRPWQSAPGDVLVVDWGHVGTVQTAAGPRPLSAFCAVLGWSRYRFVRFTTALAWRASVLRRAAIATEVPFPGAASGGQPPCRHHARLPEEQNPLLRGSGLAASARRRCPSSCRRLIL